MKFKIGDILIHKKGRSSKLYRLVEDGEVIGKVKVLDIDEGFTYNYYPDRDDDMFERAYIAQFHKKLNGLLDD